jgi:hypothetical protein
MSDKYTEEDKNSKNTKIKKTTAKAFSWIANG